MFPPAHGDHTVLRNPRGPGRPTATSGRRAGAANLEKQVPTFSFAHLRRLDATRIEPLRLNLRMHEPARGRAMPVFAGWEHEPRTSAGASDARGRWVGTGICGLDVLVLRSIHAPETHVLCDLESINYYTVTALV